MAKTDSVIEQLSFKKNFPDFIPREEKFICCKTEQNIDITLIEEHLGIEIAPGRFLPLVNM